MHNVSEVENASENASDTEKYGVFSTAVITDQDNVEIDKNNVVIALKTVQIDTNAWKKIHKAIDESYFKGGKSFY